MSLIETIINIIVDDFTSRERREFIYLTNDAGQFIKEDMKHINSGSNAEGFLNYGDRDRMYVVDNFLVVDSVEDVTDDIVENIGILIIDSQDCNPGHVRLFVHKEPLEALRILEGCYCLYNGKKYLNGKMFTNNFFSIVQEIVATEYLKVDHAISGPAILMDNGADMVRCFPCKENLKSTKQFQQQISCQILNRNNNLFYFVSKSHQYSQNHDIEFRWSFSIIEYNLIRQFTDKEFQLHFLCKELYNTYIKSNDEENENCISSYTVKTIILYLLERHKEKIKKMSMINLVKLFLFEMKCRLQEKHLPHYFIREYNLFDVLEDDEAQEVLRSIENIEKDLFSAILNCRFLMRYESLVTLYSVYRISNKINDINMQEDILRNILKERSFQKFTQSVTIRDFEDHATYHNKIQDFLINAPLTHYFDVLCIYFHCHSVFEGKYSCSTIAKFQNLLTRLLPLYLVGLASKNHRGSITHLLIETLLIRSIYLPNPAPTIIFNAKVPLAFYYYLCNEEEKASFLLTNSDISHYDNFTIMHISGGYNFPSIISNDIILKKLFESESPGTMLSFSTSFLFYYMGFRMTMDKSIIESLENEQEFGYQLHPDESKIIDILKENFQKLKN